MPLYFAYGSNLHAADWRAWCQRKGHDPSSIKPIGRAFLPDHRLVFDYRSHTRNHAGVCNLADAPGRFVEGWLFEVAPEGWAALDEKESRAIAYERVALTAITDAGEEAKIITYRVPSARLHGYAQPTDEYREIVLSARRALGLGTEEVEAAIADRVPPPPRFFIYGTLLNGEANHHRIARHEVEAAAPALHPGTLHDLGPYPGMTLRRTHDVRGELVSVARHQAALADVDELEGFKGFGAQDNLYRRTLIRAGGEWAWTYLIANPAEAPVIASGCWRTHRAAR